MGTVMSLRVLQNLGHFVVRQERLFLVAVPCDAGALKEDERRKSVPELPVV